MTEMIQRVSLEEELARDPELKKSDIKLLKEWCKTQPHLPKILDSELVLFLSSNYYDVERAKTTIEAFYTIRTNTKEYFSARDPLKNEELRQAFETTTFMPLDGETPEGYKIFFGRLINYDPSKFVWSPSMKYLHMSVDLSMFTQGAAKGHVFIFDMSNATLGHSTRMSLLGCRKLINYLQEGLPIRPKGIHFIRSMTIVQIVLGMIKPFMKKEITQTVHVHTNDETLEKFVPLDLLPNECGGKAGPLIEIHQKHIKLLEDHRDFFLEEEINCRVDESLRPRRSSGALSFFRRSS
ncbi:GSCOCG00001506001-RA-CDS [Cotesia congregata]|uniref:Similar to Ttpal: Alpha-tocopherol transfer protein-like (Mus musculus) n=1 Tax=Cotesia congregata TaxID=51543 RepID=A0A8J2ECA4_COTCN|nr:GSCOCG00001506001-RA-CDS [Cotesia congregata]CAG5076956.1 Similar to Ttpal: Alpha-tocopherol transfer protein-like (Mus musculus) [Cotesia congregata]